MSVLKDLKAKYPDCYYDAYMDAIYTDQETLADDAMYLIEDHYEGMKTWTSGRSGNPEDETMQPCSGRDYIIAELNDNYQYAFDQI